MEARRLAGALEADQPDGLTRRVRGRLLEFEFSALTAQSARITGDDLLACLSAAEKTFAGVMSGTAEGRTGEALATRRRRTGGRGRPRAAKP